MIIHRLKITIIIFYRLNEFNELLSTIDFPIKQKIKFDLNNIRDSGKIILIVLIFLNIRKVFYLVKENFKVKVF